MEGISVAEEAIEMAPGSGRRTLPSAAVLRHIAMLQALPLHPRTIGTTALREHLADLGYRTSARTIQRDLISLQQLVPIEQAGVGRPYGWRWKRGAVAHPLPVPIESAPVRLVALVYPALLHSLGDVRGVAQRDGRVRISMRISGGPALTRWVLGFGSGIEVLEPKALREELAEIAQSVSRLYSPLSDDGPARK